FDRPAAPDSSRLPYTTLFRSRLLRRFDLRQLLIGSFVLAALRWLLLGWGAGELWLLIPAQLMHAATFGCFHVAAVHFVQRHFSRSEEHTSELQSRENLVCRLL